MSMIKQFIIQKIPSKETKPWLLNRHYARRMCSISYAFGAYREGINYGVVTYGTPSSPKLREGIAGKEWAEYVIELNRLCCVSEKNLASRLVSKSLKMLPKPSIVVSYADIKQGHIGYVYQAANFLYTGLSAKRTDWKIKGQEHLHGTTVADLSRGQNNRVEWMRKKYGEDFYLEERTQKHRYVYICASNKQKTEIIKSLKYTIHPYPKGESVKYHAENKIELQTTFSLK
jgi:hypothetical protein